MGFPKPPPKPPPPPSTPTKADASVVLAGERTDTLSIKSLINSLSVLGKKSASTGKKTLIGGGGQSA